MCGQNKIMNGRRWVCDRDEHPAEPDNHRFVSALRARRRSTDANIFRDFWVRT
jgi:hypothetical protein